MRLLVSVASPAEALRALEGGADLIDAKDPDAGALGAVSLEALIAIHRAIDGERPVTAALGDADDEECIEARARAFSGSGVAFVKVGFGGITDPGRVRALMEATRRGVDTAAGETGVVAVAYADANSFGGLGPRAILKIASLAGMDGLLMDTADKSGPGLTRLANLGRLTAWVAEVREAGMFAALAGKLGADDLPRVQQAGADIAGVRGAACEGGRAGHVVATRVRELRERMATAAPAV
jgi:uncharacterized protein (UPF0264 family)